MSPFYKSIYKKIKQYISCGSNNRPVVYINLYDTPNDTNVLQPNVNLESAILKNQSLNVLPFNIFSKQYILEHIDISNNDIQTLAKNIFSGLNTLKSLNMSNNRVHFKLPREIFDKLYSLVTLNLSFNFFDSAIDLTYFKDLVSLNNLNLSHITSPIVYKVVSLNCKMGLRNLKQIENLYFDNINSFDKTLERESLFKYSENDRWNFDTFTNLKFLSFRNNKIRNLGPYCFQKLSNLVHLDLSLNMIETIHDNAFSGLDKLTRIDVSKISIKCLPENIFLNCNSIFEIDLSNNHVSSVFVSPNFVEQEEYRYLTKKLKDSFVKSTIKKKISSKKNKTYKRSKANYISHLM